MKRLPRSLDEIGGLRAARWIRESTAGQYDRYGPASQREQQGRFIERHGLIDTGLVYQVAHSGRTVWRSATMVDDLRSGGFDLLLTGYSDRWQRNLRRTLELLEDELHPNRVALVMCDRKILSSDPSDWDELISEAAGAEKYSRRLSSASPRAMPPSSTRSATLVVTPGSDSDACRSLRTPLRSTPSAWPSSSGRSSGTPSAM